METGSALLLALAAGAGAWWLITRSSAPPAPPVPKFTKPHNLGDVVFDYASARTGIPLHTLGEAASSAPPWAKVASLPIASTAFAYDVVRHPVDTAKDIGTGVKNAVIHPLDTLKSLNPFG